jgi:hypothetical protein
MKSAIFTLLFCLVCPQLLLAMPQDDFSVSSGEQSTTQKSPEINFQPGTDQHSPRIKLSAENREQLLMTGVDVLTQFIPGGQLVGKGVHLAVFAGDTAIDAVDFKTEKVEGDLQAISKDAIALKELARTPKGLQSDKAKEILARMEKTKSPNDEYSFLRKAVFSGDGLYVVARNTSSRLLADFVGEKLSKKLGIDDAIKRAFKNEGSLRKKLTRRAWKNLKRRAEIGRKLTESLKESLLQLAVTDLLEKEFKQAWDEMYQRILDRHPPSPSTRSEPASILRLEISTQPALVLPRLAEIPRLVPAPSAAPRAIEPIRPPPIIRQYQDPVVNSIAVEDQVVQAQNYNVPPSSATQNEPVDYPPARPPEPQREPPRSNFKGSIPSVPKSFDGNGRDIWH